MANTTLTEAQMKELLKKIQREHVKALYHNSDLSFMLSAYNGINQYDPRQMESYFSVRYDVARRIGHSTSTSLRRWKRLTRN